MRVIRAALSTLAFWLFAAVATAQPIEVLWLGHATFRITSVMGKVIVIDFYLTTNPWILVQFKDLAALGKVDLILVTHGHRDHTFDLPALAKLTGATIVANYELASSLVATGVVDGAKAPVAMNKGGTVSPLGSGIKVHMVPAEHSSSLELSIYKPDWTGPRFLEAGAAVGFVIEFENGFKIYHTGDTDVFPGMALIGRLHKPDLALVCIGGHYTMDPEHAAFALREYLKPKHVIPMHYGTYPVINRTPAELKAALGNSPIKVIEAKPGEPLRF